MRKSTIRATAVLGVGGLLLASAAFGAQTTSAWQFDSAFATNIGSGADSGIVYSVEQLPDGDLLTGGSFTTFGGVPTGGLVRLNADGTADTAFQSAIGTGPGSDPNNNGLVHATARLADGDILVGGGFASFNGAPAGGLIRLHNDGSVDTAFQANIGTGAYNTVSSVTEPVNHINPLPDGDILVVGYFGVFNGAPAGHLVRLNPDGTVDTAFAANIGTAFGAATDGIVYQSLRLSNGIILLAGQFANFNGSPAKNLVALNPDGTLNAAFQANVGTGLTGATGAASVLHQLPDSTILVGGSFTAYNGTPATSLVALNPDGTVQPGFLGDVDLGVDSGIKDIVPLSSGATLLVGYSLSVNGAPVNRAVSLNPDGTTDTVLQSAIGSGPNAIPGTALQMADSGILIGGVFTSFDGVPAGRLTRIAENTLTIDPIAAQSSDRGTAVDVPAVVTLTFGSGIVFSAVGLPDGVSIDPQTGRMTGTPTTVGDFSVTVSASGAALAVDTTFTWAVTEPPVPPTPTPIPSPVPTPMPTGGSSMSAVPTLPSSAQGSLAATGADVGPLIPGVLALAGCGTLLLLVRRRWSRS